MMQTSALTRRPGMDWLLLLSVLALSVLGCLLVWSATSARSDLTGGDPRAFLEKQIVNVALGLALLILVLATDHRWVRIVAPLVYLASIGGLVLVLTMGTVINGSRSWLMLGGLSIQPSEFAKLAVVIGMALVVAERAEGRWRPRVGSVDVRSIAGGLLLRPWSMTRCMPWGAAVRSAQAGIGHSMVGCFAAHASSCW